MSAAINFILEKPTSTYKGDLVKAWSVEDDWFILHWHVDKNTHAFPIGLDSVGITSVVNSWLEEHEPNEPEPNIDGSVTIGFEILAGNNGGHYELFRVRSAWMLHHK